MEDAKNQRDRIRDLLQSFQTAMLVTHGADFAHARPMAIAAVEEDCNLWFISGRDTAKVMEIEDDARVLVVCQNERTRYVSLNGRARLINDRAKARELWKSEFQAWFPGGAKDPNLLLIHVKAQEAEYWDNSGLKGLRYAFQAAKAVATGRQPAIEEGKMHGKVAV